MHQNIFPVIRVVRCLLSSSFLTSFQVLSDNFNKPPHFQAVAMDRKTRQEVGGEIGIEEDKDESVREITCMSVKLE